MTEGKKNDRDNRELVHWGCLRRCIIITTRVVPLKNTWTKLFVCLSKTGDQELPM